MLYTQFEQNQVISESGLVEALGEVLFKEARKPYDELTRQYHDFDHITNVLVDVNSVCRRYSEAQLLPYTPLEMRLAALYHDYVYAKQGSPVNERDSAAAMRKDLTGKDLPVDLDRVEKLILATAEHKDSHPSKYDFVTSLFLDCDVLSLAAPRAEFLYNTQLLVWEFSEWYERDVVIKGQKDFYSLMLSKPCIYMTPEFRDHYERIARDNMQYAVNIDLGELLK